MKRIFITFILALFTLFVSAQVKVLGKIEPNGPTDTYPTHVDSLGKGGFVAVSTWQERNSIPTPRRKAGMMVSVKSASVDSLYRLGVGLTNADWLPYVASMDVSGKANLAGGNTFTGVQKTDTSFIVTNPNSEARLEKDLLQFRDLVGRGKVFNLKANLNSPNSSVEVLLPETSGVLATVEALGTKANLAGGNTFKNAQVMNSSYGNTTIDGNAIVLDDVNGGTSLLTNNPAGNSEVIQLPARSGVLALEDDIPNISGKANLWGGNTFTGDQIITGAIIGTNNSFLNYTSGINYTGVSVARPVGRVAVFDENGGRFRVGTASNTPFHIITNNNPKISILEDGRVGIGTTSPNATLEVEGNVKVKQEPWDDNDVVRLKELKDRANLSGDNTFTGANVFNGGINVSDSDIYGTTTIEGRNIWMTHNSSGNSARLSVANPSTIGLEVNSADESKRFSLNPNQLSFQDYGNAKYSTVTPNQTQANEFVTVELPGKSGTLATTSDIPKMLMVSAISTGSITYSFTHGLSYTPTMVVVTANSDGAIVNGDKSAPLTSSAKINGANIDITIYGTSVAFGENVGPEVGAELKWTIMVK